MIKLVAFDVDGTLRDNEVLPASTVEAIRTLKERGVALTLCTGRSDYEMTSLRETLGIEWAITCNGSHVAHNGKTVYGQAFAKETIQRWLEIAELRNQAILMYGEAGMYINRENDPSFLQAQKEIGLLEPTLLKVGEPTPDMYQCIVFCTEEEESAYVGDRREDYYIHRWRTWAVDFNPKGMNKSVGLLQLIEHLGLNKDEVAVFGDGKNDIEMFECAGMGIAMGNGIDEVKRIARHVTKSLHEDGIHYAVHKWILPENHT